MELLDEIENIPGIKAQLRYLDDGTFIGTRESVSILLKSLVHKGPSFGVYINMNKCEPFWSSGDQEFHGIDSQVRWVNINSRGSELLGSPIIDLMTSSTSSSNHLSIAYSIYNLQSHLSWMLPRPSYIS